MKHAKMLDCTLRDGAYLVDKTFGDNVIHGMIHGLIDANIDIVEIGFLQNEGFGEGKTVFLNGKDAKRFIPKEKRNTMFTVLADCSRYDVNNLDENTGDTIDAVRVCFFKHERYDAIEFCKKVYEKGYEFFVQPVDVLGYTDKELIELIEKVNELKPYCFSIVDTFGSMYSDDLQRVYHLINHNLTFESKIGFHSHNNMQMSSALTQEFLRMTFGTREVVVDTTVSGMGRGAGNTPTELVAQYMVSKLGYTYDIDAILDLIDTYMPGIRAKCSWGYTTPYFIAGCYSAHVNNISYLSNKNGIDSKGIRYILNKIGEQARKRYDYDLLENTYADYLSSDIDDTNDVQALEAELCNKDIVIVAPGKTISSAVDKIKKLKENGAVIIAINHLPNDMDVDYIFVSNGSRYNYWQNDESFKTKRRIFTSNLISAKGENDYVISYKRVLKCGWESMDNSCILLLRLLDKIKLKSIGIAGFDGYEFQFGTNSNYAQKDMERSISLDDVLKINKELLEMFRDIVDSSKDKSKFYFVTPSRFESAMKEI